MIFSFFIPKFFVGTFSFFCLYGLLISECKAAVASAPQFAQIVSPDSCFNSIQQAHNLINSNPDSAIKLVNFVESSNNCLISNDLKYQIALLRLTNHYRTGQMKFAVELGEKMLDSIPEDVGHKTLVHLMNGLSDVYLFLGMQVRSFELNYVALRAAIYLKDTASIVQSLNAMGDIQHQTDKSGKKLAYYELALELATEMKSKNYQAICFTSLGGYYLRENSFDTALRYFDGALKIYEDLEYKERSAMLKIRVGRVYMNRESLDTAFVYFSDALADGKKHGALHAVGRSYNNMGRLMFGKGDYRQALVYLDSAIQVLYQVEDIIVLNNITQLKSSILEKNGNLDSALHYFKIHKELDDSVKVIKGSEEIGALELNFKLQSKENDILYLSEKDKINKEKQRAELKARVWLVVAIIILVVVMLALFGLFRQRSRLLTQEKDLRELDQKQSEQSIMHEKEIAQLLKETHDIELEQKNKELTTLTLQMLRKSEDLSGIHTELKEVEVAIAKTKSVDVQVLTKIRKISKGILNNPAQEQEWEQFKFHFENVHTRFFDKLSANHPELTSYDLKLCAYFHMNLGSKQVAKMLNVSPDAIKKQRTRMRKKMKLSAETDLQQHIAFVAAKKHYI